MKIKAKKTRENFIRKMLRRRKAQETAGKPTFRPMTHEEQKWMILSVFKRVRDMDYAQYLETIRRRNEI